MSVVCSRVVSVGQPHHHCSLGLLDSVVRPTAPVAVSKSCDSLFSISIQEPPDLALAYPENLGSLANGDPVFQDVVEYVQSREFSLFQCHILHGWTFSLNS